MKNIDLIKLSNEKMKDKFWKATKIAALATFISIILMYTGVGGIMVLPLSYGLLKTIVLLKNGQDVKVTDFFKNGMNEFGRIWCTQLLIYLRMLIPYIIAIISTFFINRVENNFINITLMILNVVMFIFMAYILLKYSLVNFELLNCPEIRSRDIIKQYNVKIKGNVIKIIGMNIYYGVLRIIPSSVLLVLTAFIIKNVISSFDNELERVFLGLIFIILIIFLLCILSPVVTVLAEMFISPRNISSNDELYNYITKKNVDENEIE